MNEQNFSTVGSRKFFTKIDWAAFWSATLAAFAGTTMAYAMKPNEILHNFTVQSVTELPEVPGRLWRMTYAKNGAELAWLEREDENKTFAIAFKTVPPDNTGVAHIMEHSVLCGSKKYPVKEPFVDLLKSSLEGG